MVQRTALLARPPIARRADAGMVRLGDRDVAGLVLCGEMYGAPYDLLAAYLDVRANRLRGIVARRRQAGYAATGRLGAGPTWCWLTRAGLGVTGQPYIPARPAVARLAHLRAVLAVRLSLEASPGYRDGRAWWRSERRIRGAIGGRATVHVPDAEVSWPDLPASPYAGECWAIEAELTPKPLARTAGIMAVLAARTADYCPGSAPGTGPRYARVVYLAAPAARAVTERAAATLPPSLGALPTLAGILDHAPQRLQAQLFAALDLQLVYKKDTHQVTIYAAITPATPHALTAIINTSQPPTTSGLDPSPQHHRRC